MDDRYGMTERFSTYISMHYDTALLDEGEEAVLFRTLHNGPACARRQARDELIMRNMRLVINIAYTYKGCAAIDDIIEDGTVGLITAIDKFDPSMGHKLATYATWWIRQCINRSLNKTQHTIRIPDHRYLELRKLRRAEDAIHRETGQRATDQELADATGVDLEMVGVLRTASSVISLEAQPARMGMPEVPYTECLPVVAEEDEPVDKEDVLAEIRGMINAALSELDERSRTLVMARFGLITPKGLQIKRKTTPGYREIGKWYGLTGERVRQIVKEAVTILANDAQFNKVQELMHYM